MDMVTEDEVRAAVQAITDWEDAQKASQKTTQVGSLERLQRLNGS